MCNLKNSVNELINKTETVPQTRKQTRFIKGKGGEG